MISGVRPIQTRSSSVIVICILLLTIWPLPVEGENRNVTMVRTPNLQHCKDGLLVKMWRPTDNLSTPTIAGRGIVYLLSLFYLFVGISIATDRFMESIEVITSREKLKVLKVNGRSQIVVTRFWNPTLANLTLMAFGSSAPEVLISTIEIIGTQFEAGDLGPGTVVGSAAYNLFITSAICIIALPRTEVKRIKMMGVFVLTSIWALFAYIWMFLCVCVITPGSVSIFEAVTTLLFAPALLATAYMADKKMLCFKYDKPRSGAMQTQTIDRADSVSIAIDTDLDPDIIKSYEDCRMEYIGILNQLRKKYPRLDMNQIELMALDKIIDKCSNSIAFYHMKATRQLLGTGNVTRKIQERIRTTIKELKAEKQIINDLIIEEESPIRILFEPIKYTVLESCGQFAVRVVRRGDLSDYSSVQYATTDGTAKAGSDYVAVEGSLLFQPGVEELTFNIEIIDDDVFELDEYFFIHLSNPLAPAILDTQGATATVVILDDDHSGLFTFIPPVSQTMESVKVYEIKVSRYAGGRGKVIVPFWSENVTAIAGQHYEAIQGDLLFDNKETEKTLKIPIIDEGAYKKNVTFVVHLGDPYLAPDDEMVNALERAERKISGPLSKEETIVLAGKPKKGTNPTASITITESQDFKNAIDRLIQRYHNSAKLLQTPTWREQFMTALSVGRANIDTEQTSEEDLPLGVKSYILHYLTLFWKILFAFVPPSGKGKGYPCFFVSLFFIGLLTVIVSDLASHFGCTVGMHDAVTAAILVSVGTSVPDTFASITAALSDSTADAAIGNINGSNALNVFIGLGMAWTIAASYHTWNGDEFIVVPTTVTFAVTIYCVGAIIAFLLYLWRRMDKKIRGELGGPLKTRILSCVLFIALWIGFALLIIFEAYGVINVFD